MLAQPAAQLWSIDFVVLGIAGDWHVEQRPLPVTAEGERAAETRIDAEDVHDTRFL
jgi:hypothetical protein